MLTVSADPEQWGWLKATLLQPPHVLPEGFDSYCVLVHRAYEAPKGRNGAEMTVRELSLANKDLPANEKHRRTYDQVDELRGEFDWDQNEMPPANIKRVSWRDLAKDYGISYDLDLMGRFYRLWQGSAPVFLLGWDEGNIDMLTLDALFEHLAPFTGGQSCYFYYVLFANYTLKDLLLAGSLADIRGGFGEFSRVTPTHWWPTDRSWCLWSDYDATFSAVGGPKALIDGLLADPNLDCIELQDPASLFE